VLLWVHGTTGSSMLRTKLTGALTSKTRAQAAVHLLVGAASVSAHVACVHAWVRACVGAWVRVCVCACVCVCVCAGP